MELWDNGTFNGFQGFMVFQGFSRLFKVFKGFHGFSMVFYDTTRHNLTQLDATQQKFIQLGATTWCTLIQHEAT
jgi:hypothetical protein